MEDRGSRVALLLCDDLIFTSRIAGEARAAGVVVKSARSIEILKNLAQTAKPRLLIIDLANPGLVIEDLLTWINSLATDERLRVVAYGSHVDTATLKAARAAGCDEVMPRSQFVERLPMHLNDWIAKKH